MSIIRLNSFSADCSFGQIENLKAGKCEWTARWEHSDKGEFFRDVAEVRLSKIAANLSQGQTTTALKALEPLLVNGNPGAQRIAGLMHLYGRGVSKDRQKALQLLANNHPYAEPQNEKSK